jgi:antitoxin PrlF
MSKPYTSVVTQKGQVTIPAEIRRALGIKTSDRVVFILEEGRVFMEPTAETLDSVYGAVEPLQRPEDFQRRRDDAIEDHVERTMRETDANDVVP